MQCYRIFVNIKIIVTLQTPLSHTLTSSDLLVECETQQKQKMMMLLRGRMFFFMFSQERIGHIFSHRTYVMYCMGHKIVEYIGHRLLFQFIGLLGKSFEGIQLSKFIFFIEP